MEKRNYNFVTAISMVVGVVIGSGIFYKSDDILLAVDGNVCLGLVGFLLVGLGVLFGALTIAYYAQIDKGDIGLIEYGNIAFGKKFGFIVGWISYACYFPTLIVILALLTVDYIGMLIGVDSKLFITIGTLIVLVSNYWLNIKRPRLSGQVQVASTIAKTIPLILIGIIGSLFFTPEVSQVTGSEITGGSPITALVAIAFSFDGWIVATSISNDLENSKKNLPRALAIGSILITVIYCLYFYGITHILSPEQIVSLGDEHIIVASQMLVGNFGSKLILIFIIISVYGGFNGMTLAYLRIPQVMIDSNMIKGDKTNSFKSSLKYCISMTIIYFVFEQLLDYQIVFSNLDEPFDISAMPIVIIYIVYTILFLAVNKLTKNESIAVRIYYLIISLIASITSIIIVYGGLGINGLLYIGCTLIICVCAVPFIVRN